ncbi:hypothetical protein, partial [uncultured Chloroflexus sp.]|uniref:hypothetical protein n=1 Tax=uncultured Chloroflexus sp. TaxID=214040 RepID=UPI00262B36AD
IGARVSHSRANFVSRDRRGIIAYRLSAIGYRLSSSGRWGRFPPPCPLPAHRLSAIDPTAETAEGLSAIGYRLSAIGYRLSAIAYRLSAIAYRPSHTL